ncbi:tetratricopeptide repeat protein [Crocinitomix catalasitica]|uniref:tetratricopeptide repeat protein n=1 Tax=Crocinitomix catalasitica TaxID=184607 RepID=UPI0004890823|nr:tetratricopeptide repeat protein [Crocinitomix catalasitica]
MTEKSKNILRSIQQLPFLGIVFVLLVLSACGNSKNVGKTETPVIRKSFKEAFHEAVSEKMIGHNENAIALFESCLLIEPENPAVFFALSDLYEQAGDQTKKLTFAEKAYSYDQNNKWYILRLADLYYEKQEFTKTVDLYSKIIENEKNIDLKFQYVDALMRAQKFQRAIDMLNEIEVETGVIPQVSFTKHDLYMQLQNEELAKAELDKLITENPSEYEFKMMVAEYYMQQQDFSKANALIDDILQSDADFGQAYIMKADLALRQSKVLDAFKLLEIGFDKDDVQLDRKLELIGGLIPYAAPGQADAEIMRTGITDLFEQVYDESAENSKLHEYYGYFLADNMNLIKAEKQLELATKFDPSKFNVWAELTRVEMELNAFDRLFANGEKMISYFPSQPFAYLITGLSGIKIEKYDESEEYLILGKDLVIDAPELLSNFYIELGKLKYAQGKKDKGIEYLNKASQTYPKNLQVYDLKAKLFMQDNDYVKAEQTIKEGLEMNAKDPILLETYGVLLIEKKQYPQAIEVFESVLVYDSYNITALEYYGDALFLSGREKEALEFWIESKKQGNTSPIIDKKIEEKKYYAN